MGRDGLCGAAYGIRWGRPGAARLDALQVVDAVMTRSVLGRILTEEERRPPPEFYERARWYACYTRARHEKRVAAALGERGIEAFLPMLEQLRQWKDRKKRVALPLFPGYVFGRFDLGSMHSVLTIPGVATIVRANGYPTPIPDRELENVRRFAAALGATGAEAEVRPFLGEGDWVRVMEGPFAGVEGIILELRGRRRVLVGLRAIGQGLEVDLDRFAVEAVVAPEREEATSPPGAGC